MTNDSLGDRMKNYENSFRHYLSKRMPVILRVDGSHFHTYTKGCKRPVDQGLVECMNDTAIELCKKVQGCQLAYVQSDEISLLVTNYQDIDTQSWFDNNLQKMISISASIASVTFTMNSWKIWVPVKVDPGADPASECDFNKPAYFDSRAFVLPKEDVNNYFLWRQQDATRNSVQMLARTLYSHKELNNKNNSELQDMCWNKGINWNDCPTFQKRGRCIVKRQLVKMANIRPYTDKTGKLVTPSERAYKEATTVRTVWAVDNEIPIFSQDKSYVEQYVFPGA